MTVRGATTQILTVELLTYKQVADMLHVSVRTVERLIADGQLACVRPTPSTPRIHSDDLRAYISGCRQEAAPASIPLPPSALNKPGTPRSPRTPARRSFLDDLMEVEHQ